METESASAAAGWTAADDLVLKSAVEAGASLESLAKGAACFSCSFTLQELQNRWYSLLYDSETSAQASARMAKYETELFTSNPAKANKLFNSKAKGFSVYKRKIDSVKVLYYARIKRVRHESCLSADYGYVVAPCTCIRKDGSGCTCGGELKCSEDHQLVHKVNPSGGGISNYGCASGSSFDMEHTNSDGSIVIDGDSNHGILKGYSDVSQLYEHDYMQKNPLTGEQNIVSTDNSSDLINHFDSETTGTKALLSIDQNGINDDHDSWNSTGGLLEPVSLCSQSPSSSIPTWNKLLGVCSPDMLTNVHRNEQDTLMLSDGKKNSNDAVVFQENLDHGMSDSGLGNTMVPEGGFMHSSMKCFSEKEDLDLLSSEHVLDSTTGANWENVGDSDTNVFLKRSSREPHLPRSDRMNCGDHTDAIQKKLNLADGSGVETIPLSTEVLYPRCDVACILNTEDSEIPINDHIPIPGWTSSEPTSTLDQDSQHDMCLVPTKPLNMENVVPAPTQSLKLESAIQEQKEIMVSLDEGGLVGNLPPGMHGDSGGSNVDMHMKALHSIDEGDEKASGLFQHECCDNLHNSILDKSIQVPDEMNFMLLADKPNIQRHTVSQALPDKEFHHPVPSMSTSAQAEGSDSENSVPDYFDLEALILDQDLIPWDQESDFIQPEVSRFHSTESRKDLIRLEKGACSYMNRSIMSKGAFAIIYGQHLRYYIRDPEVILGRETGEVHVDIDLGKEGTANKISRRQAIIKMDDHGSFYMKNIGKGSIFVNGKEIPCNKRIVLTSDSLIEIRNMKFIFHVNHNAVRQHVVRARRESSQRKNTAFDWIQEP